MLARLRTSFLTGIVVIAPVALTLWLIWSVIGWFDGFVLHFVPDAYRPEQILNTIFGYDLKLNIRGVGVVVFLVFATLVGWLAKGLIGRSFIRYAENLVNRMPVVRSFYTGIKQNAETVFAQQERSIEKACKIEYPRKGIWAIGIISTTAKGEIAERNSSKGPMVSVFVPTTPNPTSGFLLFFPKADIVELDMSIEDAAKLVISAGLVYPPTKKTSSKSTIEKSRTSKKA